MRRLLCVHAASSILAASAAAAEPSPADVVDRQLAAYNAKNVDAFVACYAPDAELFEFPDKPLAKGAAALRERYGKRFADPLLHASIANRTVAIYEVQGGAIARVWFIFGAKTVDAKK